MSTDSENSKPSAADSQSESEVVASGESDSAKQADDKEASSKKAASRKASGKTDAAASAKETGKILDEISRGTSAKPGRSANRKKGSLSGLLTLFVLLLPLLAGIGWLAWQQMQMQQTLASTNQQNQQLQTMLASQQSEIEALRQRPEATPAPDNSAELAALQTSLNNEIRRLQQQLAAVQNRPAAAAATPDFNWKVFEAEYLVNAANQKLQLDADVNGAITLLEQADVALLAANHASGFNARQAIAEDLARLRAVEIFDTEGVYLRLESLINNVGQLDLLGSMREDFEGRRASNSSAVSESGNTPGWLNATLAFLGDVFVWREWEERPEAMLAPGQETLIKLNLRLLLEQAQLSLLQKDPQQFRSSLDQTGEWLRRYAALDTAAGRGINAELSELMALDIDPPMPTLSAALTAVRQLADSER